MWVFQEIILVVVILAFVAELLDIGLGMGYGTAMSSVLLLMDFPLLEIVSALLINNVVLGLIATFFHIGFESISLEKGKPDLRVIALISGIGIIGALAGVFTTLTIPTNYVKIYIGVLVILAGIITLTAKIKKKKYSLSFSKLVGFSSIAAFNKGLSGGGYGPVIVSGQIISGIDSRRAIAIATTSEGIVSIVGTLAFLMTEISAFNWSLVFSLFIGSIAAIPIATFFVSKVNSRFLKKSVGVVTILLGLALLFKAFY